jgi:hypothetical protein
MTEMECYTQDLRLAMMLVRPSQFLHKDGTTTGENVLATEES